MKEEQDTHNANLNKHSRRWNAEIKESNDLENKWEMEMVEEEKYKTEIRN